MENDIVKEDLPLEQEEVVTEQPATVEEVTPANPPVEDSTPEAAQPTEEETTTEEALTTEEGTTTEETPAAEVTGIRKLIKKWWFWTIIGAVVLAIIVGIVIGVSASNSSSGSSHSYVAPVSPYVTLVKTAKNSNYGITYGAAFDKFFTSPRWRYFKADSGEDVVEFEGGFYYDGSPAKAKIQFVLDLSEGSLQVYHLSINGVAQNKLMLAAMVKKVFESY